MLTRANFIPPCGAQYKQYCYYIIAQSSMFTVTGINVHINADVYCSCRDFDPNALMLVQLYCVWSMHADVTRRHHVYRFLFLRVKRGRNAAVTRPVTPSSACVTLSLGTERKSRLEPRPRRAVIIINHCGSARVFSFQISRQNRR